MSLKLPAMLQRQQTRAERQSKEAYQEAAAAMAVLRKRGLRPEQVPLYMLFQLCILISVAFITLPVSDVVIANACWQTSACFQNSCLALL